jgi:hypothetical protein
MAKKSENTVQEAVINTPKKTSKTALFVICGLVLLTSIAGFTGGWLYSQYDTNQNDNKEVDNQVIVTQTEAEIKENKVVTNDKLSVQQAEIIKADEIKTEPVKTETTQTNQPVTLAITQKNYTNQFFPDFKLVYLSDWELTTQTSKSYDEGLLNREIKLSKNGTTLNVSWAPFTLGGCGGYSPDFETFHKTTYTAKNNMKEHYVKFTDTNNTLDYTYNVECSIGNLLTSNIKADTIQSFKDTGWNDNNGNIRFLFSATTNIDGETRDSNPQLQEVRSIIENSTFK